MIFLKLKCLAAVIAAAAFACVLLQKAEAAGARIIKTSSSTNLTAYLKDDGTVWTLGAGYLTMTKSGGTSPPKIRDIQADSSLVYAIGENNKIYKFTPNGGYSLYSSTILVKNGMDSLAVGSSILLYIAQDSTVWGMGSNYYGALGINKTGYYLNNGMTDYESNFVQMQSGEGISTPFTEANMIFQGERDVVVWNITATAIIKETDNAVYVTGPYAKSPSSSTNTAAPIPIKKVDGMQLTNIKKIAIGQGFYIALDYSGQIWVWGQNNYGQLGDGTTTTTDYTKAKLLASASFNSEKIKDVAAGARHAVAVTESGNVYVWGGK